MRTLLGALPLLALLLGTAAAVDLALHRLGLGWLDRPAGYLGSLLILLSFVYSARKRKLLRFGRPAALLRLHEVLTWIGSVLVLIHGGTHFNAALPWLALGAMVVVAGSGLTGKHLLSRSRSRLAATRVQLLAEGLPPDEADGRLYWDSLAVGAMKRWRAVHMPITGVFAVLAGLHVLTALMFREW